MNAADPVLLGMALACMAAAVCTIVASFAEQPRAAGFFAVVAALCMFGVAVRHLPRAQPSGAHVHPGPPR